ncbi:MAG: TonB family protein [Neisseria sp.]
MNIRHILSSTFVAIALLAGANTATAQDVQFYQKASEAKAPISGNVALRLTITPDGQTENVRITRTSGSSTIDNAAVAWMDAQTMRPVTINGTPQEFSIVKEIKFSDANALKVSMR